VTFAAFVILVHGLVNTLASGCFLGFPKKKHKRTWLCAGIYPVR